MKAHGDVVAIDDDANCGATSALVGADGSCWLAVSWRVGQWCNSGESMSLCTNACAPVALY